MSEFFTAFFLMCILLPYDIFYSIPHAEQKYLYYNKMLLNALQDSCQTSKLYTVLTTRNTSNNK